MKQLLGFLLGLPLWVSLSAAQTIAVDKGFVTGVVRDEPLSAVLDHLTSKAPLNLVLGEDVGEELVSAEFKGIPLDEALRRLLEKHDAFYFYAAAENSPPVLRSIWVYRKGAGAMLKPVPPSAWSGTTELFAMLGDTDPAVRERAYEALMARADRRSRDSVLAALRGTGEKDQGMRERLLSKAVSGAFQVPVEMLADMARSDLAEQIRWMALDALAQDPAAARNAAEAALTDSSEAVRERAKEILSSTGPK